MRVAQFNTTTYTTWGACDGVTGKNVDANYRIIYYLTLRMNAIDARTRNGNTLEKYY